MARSIGIVGAAELQRKLRELAKIASADVVRDAAGEGAKVIKEEAQRLVPVVSGDLQESIDVQPLEQGNGTILIGIGSDLPYARRIEYGFVDTDSLGRNYHQSAQPYMRPALDEHGGEAVAAITKALQDRLREVGGS